MQNVQYLVSDVSLQPQPPPRLLTLEEAARELRLSTKTILRFEAKGLIKLVKLGRRKLCPRAELERLERDGTDTQ